MRSNTYVKLEMVYKRYRGYVRTQDLLKEGFSNRQIAVLVEEGYLEKVSHGYYWLSGGQCTKPQDYKCIEACLSNPRAVICMDSALYYQKAITEEPEYLAIATERTDRSKLKMNFPTRRHYFSNSNFRIGLREQETEFGCYHIYDVERSICDVLRLEPQITLKFIDCVKNNEQQYERLLKYAELLRIKKPIIACEDAGVKSITLRELYFGRMESLLSKIHPDGTNLRNRSHTHIRPEEPDA